MQSIPNEQKERKELLDDERCEEEGKTEFGRYRTMWVKMSS